MVDAAAKPPMASLRMSFELLPVPPTPKRSLKSKSSLPPKKSSPMVARPTMVDAAGPAVDRQ